MPRFFVDSASVIDGHATIMGDDAHHISRSLRMRPGEELTLCDGKGCDYHCSIISISDRAVECEVVSEEQNLSEPPYRAAVYQALAKGDRFDTVIQKAVECGAVKIIPVMTKRCTVKLDSSDFPKKCARWCKIAEEAAKQCGRGIIPQVEYPITFDKMMEELKTYDIPLFCYEAGTYPIKKALASAPSPECDVAIVIGPEGGFAAEEAESVRNSGVIPVSLGRRILRTESAAPFVLACVSYAFEQIDE